MNAVVEGFGRLDLAVAVVIRPRHVGTGIDVVLHLRLEPVQRKPAPVLVLGSVSPRVRARTPAAKNVRCALIVPTARIASLNPPAKHWFMNTSRDGSCQAALNPSACRYSGIDPSHRSSGAGIDRRQSSQPWRHVGV